MSNTRVGIKYVFLIIPLGAFLLLWRVYEGDSLIYFAYDPLHGATSPAYWLIASLTQSPVVMKVVNLFLYLVAMVLLIQDSKDSFSRVMARAGLIFGLTIPQAALLYETSLVFFCAVLFWRHHRIAPWIALGLPFIRPELLILFPVVLLLGKWRIAYGVVYLGALVFYLFEPSVVVRITTFGAGQFLRYASVPAVFLLCGISFRQSSKWFSRGLVLAGVVAMIFTMHRVGRISQSGWSFDILTEKKVAEWLNEVAPRNSKILTHEPQIKIHLREDIRVVSDDGITGRVNDIWDADFILANSKMQKPKWLTEDLLAAQFSEPPAGVHGTIAIYRVLK